MYIILGILFFVLPWTITVTRNTPDSYKIFFPILPNWQDDGRLAAVRLGTSTCINTHNLVSLLLCFFFFFCSMNKTVICHDMCWCHVDIMELHELMEGSVLLVFSLGRKKCEKNIFWVFLSKKKQEGGKTISWLWTRQYSVASRTQSTPPLRIARKSSYIFSNSFRNSSSIFTLMSKSYLLLN